MATRARSRPQAPDPRRPMLASARAALAGVPTAAWLCALVAVLNAIAWSLVTPPFHIPDESSHYAYAEYLAQHRQPPIARDRDVLSTSETIALADLAVEQVKFNRADGTIWTATDERRLAHDLGRHASRRDGNGAALEVGGQPPLYYALEAIPYALGGGGTALDRLALMRLLSALLGGVTVLFTYLFLREALPASRWSWSVGALGVALQPLFGFMTGGVNPDALLYAAGAALFYLIARTFRRGLTQGGAIAFGAVLAVGMLTKFNFAGLVPGAALALLVVAIRQEGWRTRALRLPALALAIGAAPVLLEMALNALVWDRPVVGATKSAFGSADVHPALGSAASYVWQFYIAPLPGMTRYFGTSIRVLWLDGFLGRFGWAETEFSGRVYDLALLPLGALVALAAATLLRRRAAVRRRRVELGAYALLAGSFMVFVALASYVVFLRFHGSIAQTRYLLPLLPLYGVLLALAARGAGRRWTPAVGTAIVVLALAHGVFSQLLVVTRYYS